LLTAVAGGMVQLKTLPDAPTLDPNDVHGRPLRALQRSNRASGSRIRRRRSAASAHARVTVARGGGAQCLHHDRVEIAGEPFA
jgi:hypothetical protein